MGPCLVNGSGFLYFGTQGKARQRKRLKLGNHKNCK
jgi:hypothetical protein